MKIILSLLITVLIFGVAGVPLNLRADQSLPVSPGKPGVVMRFTGTVATIGADTCMDGAAFILTQTLGDQVTKTRLKPANDDVKKILGEAAISGSKVSAVGRMGSMVPQCSYLEVTSAEIAKVVAEKSN